MCYPTNSSNPSGFGFLTATGDVEGFVVFHQASGSGRCGREKTSASTVRWVPPLLAKAGRFCSIQQKAGSSSTAVHVH